MFIFESTVPCLKLKIFLEASQTRKKLTQDTRPKLFFKLIFLSVFIQRNQLFFAIDLPVLSASAAGAAAAAAAAAHSEP